MARKTDAACGDAANIASRRWRKWLRAAAIRECSEGTAVAVFSNNTLARSVASR